VEKYKIILTFTYRNHLDQVTHHAVRFFSIPDLKNYLRWEPEKAMHIGYGEVDEERLSKSKTANVSLAISYGRELLRVTTAKELAAFLGMHRQAANALQFKN
jgi:hypothetical protein